MGKMERMRNQFNSGQDCRDRYLWSLVPLSLLTAEGAGSDGRVWGLTMREAISIVHLSLKYVPLLKNEPDLPKKDN